LPRQEREGVPTWREKAETRLDGRVEYDRWAEILDAPLRKAFAGVQNDDSLQIDRNVFDK
jgi:hypothetical protein